MQKYPKHWKIENGVALKIIPQPLSESDLRIISKTPYLSKLYEGFLCDWLIEVIKPYLDTDQFGVKGLSITHYLVQLLHFVQSSLDSCSPTAVIASYIDMSQAFNRVDHSLLIQDLFDMHCPSWLLRICFSFLTERVLIFQYKGNIASPKNLPGGSPQGCLLGVIFLLLNSILH